VTQRTVVSWCTGVLLAVCGTASVAGPSSGPPAARAVLLQLNGPIGPATSDFFVRNLRAAQQSRAGVLIAQLDTPGGLDTAMRDINQAILASPLPIVVYVAPAGARAASAGTYLLYASHLAAMAPATNLGAATPVQLVGPTSPPRPSPAKPDDPAAEKPQSGGATGAAMERKSINDAAAYIRALAQLRGRNAQWAEMAVMEAATLSAGEALEQRVIDVIATDVTDLLEKIDGRAVMTSAGKRILATRQAAVETIVPDWRTQLLSVLTNPNIAYVLLLIGIYGLLLEGYNPGAVLPGVVGSICLLLALYAFQVLAINYAGLALMLLGVVLIAAEAFVPSGALAVGGVVSFVMGSVMLLDRDVPGFSIARPLIAAMGLVGGVIAVLIVTYAVRARARPVVTGIGSMLSETATAVEAFAGQGMVRIRGELWRAQSREPVAAGQPLRVVRVNGLTLDVELLEPPADDHRP
jgi:membrane-bound serine protease (ClpP class)